jgi:hypothetical protein
MHWSDILILVAVGANAYWLTKQTNFLKSKLKTQSEFIEDAKKIVEMYRAPVADHEQLMKLAQEKAEADKQKAMKGIEDEIKAKALKSIHVFRTESEALVKLAIGFVSEPELVHYTKKYLEEMSDNAISKKLLLEAYERNYQAWGKYPDFMIKALIVQTQAAMAAFKADKKKLEEQK